MKIRSIIPACCALLSASTPFAAQAQDEGDPAGITITNGDLMPQYVEAICEENSGCQYEYDFADYMISETNNWQTITASLIQSELRGVDGGWCSVVLQCADGSYPSDNEVNNVTCSVSCPGSYAQYVYVEVGVKQP